MLCERGSRNQRQFMGQYDSERLPHEATVRLQGADDLAGDAADGNGYDGEVAFGVLFDGRVRDGERIIDVLLLEKDCRKGHVTNSSTTEKEMEYTWGPTSLTRRASSLNHPTTVSVASAVLPVAVPSSGMGTMNEKGISGPSCAL